MAVRPEQRMPLTRERVLEAAIGMVDDGGIETLSMRKLGQALGVEAMSLYNHVANKQDILGGIVDLVLNEFELPSAEEDWQTAIWRCAISAHEALLRHPWACNLIMSGVGARAGRLRYMESLLRRLREAGFSAEATYHAYHALDSHILGFTLWQLGHRMPADLPPMRSKEEFALLFATMLPGFRIEDFPHLLEHGLQHFTEGSHKDEGEFEFGLRLILDGLKQIRDAP